MYSIVELLDCMVDLLLTFWETAILFSIQLNQFIFPSILYEGSFFFFLCMASFPELVVPCLLDNDHFDRCEVIIFHCSFDLHFPAAAAAAAKALQSCPTLCDPIDGSPPGSPVPGILQARTLEWVAVSFSTAFPCWYDIVHLFTCPLSILMSSLIHNLPLGVLLDFSLLQIVVREQWK